MSNHQFDWKLQCIRISRKFKKCRIFSIFETQQELKNAFPSLPSYDYSSFKDLTKIFNKLETNGYSSINEWMADIQQVWIKGIDMGERNNLPLLSAISIEFRNKCVKFFLNMNENKQQEFWKKAAELAKQLNKTTYRSPKELSCSIPVKNISVT